MSINCGSPMEAAYYSSSLGRRDICYYCGATDAETNKELRKNSEQSYHSVKPARTSANKLLPCDQMSKNPKSKLNNF